MNGKKRKRVEVELEEHLADVYEEEEEGEERDWNR